MELSSNGIAVIKNFEGLRLNAYRDSAGIWTIGYGSTRYHDQKAVKPGDKLANEKQADVLFIATLAQYVAAVNKAVKVPLTQNQFDALVSIVYNVGTGITTKSTLFRVLNEGDYLEAADQFLVWNKITDPNTGQKVTHQGLLARRRQERGLFLKP